MAYFVELSGVLDIVEPTAVDAEERSEFLAGHLSDVMHELSVLEHDILFASSADATLSTGAVEITVGVRVNDPIAVPSKPSPPSAPLCRPPVGSLPTGRARPRPATSIGACDTPVTDSTWLCSARPDRHPSTSSNRSEPPPR